MSVVLVTVCGLVVKYVNSQTQCSFSLREGIMEDPLWLCNTATSCIVPPVVLEITHISEKRIKEGMRERETGRGRRAFFGDHKDSEL